jgi:Ca2+-binding EF-hand superfamily protein
MMLLLTAAGPATAVEMLGAADYFEKLDSNRDRRISTSELSSVPPLAVWFDAADEDADGTLDTEEFARLLRLPSEEGPRF